MRKALALLTASILCVPADAAPFRAIALQTRSLGYHGAAQGRLPSLKTGSSFLAATPSLHSRLIPTTPTPGVVSPAASPELVLDAALAEGPAVALLPQTIALSRPEGKGTLAGRLSSFYDGGFRKTDAGSPVLGLKDNSSGNGLSPRGKKPGRRLERYAVPGLLGLSALLFADQAFGGGFGAVLASPIAAVLPLLSQASYWAANVLAFVFIFPQIYTMMKNGSAKISRATLAVGLASTAAMTLDFAYDGQALMTYRNLALAAGFGAGLLLKSWFDRRKASAVPDAKAHYFRVGKWKLQVPATVKTVGIATAIAGALFILGPAALAWAPSLVWMRGLMVPLQIASGLGLIYLMFPQLLKIEREGAVGDASKTMVQGYLGTRSIWVWSFATALSITAGYSAAGLPVLLAFVCAVFPLSWLLLRWASKLRLPRLPEKVRVLRWEFSRERIESVAAFAAISAAVLSMTTVGYGVMGAILDVPAAESGRFMMYLFYLVQNVVATLVTLLTLRAFSRAKK